MQQSTLKYESEKLEQILEKMRKQKEYLSKSLLNNVNMYSKDDYVRAHLIYLGEKKLKELEKMQSKPYFARLDFRETSEEAKEKLYIGKLSLLDEETHRPIIVDWRAPIANLYYDGRIGKVEYTCLGQLIKGEILLKRQFVIENGKLEKYSDIDLTTNDELLQDALGQNADSRLKNIVSTIQEEQNKIIRANMFKPLIVQGVAGSGKTTIALHRIAYLIYNYEKDFKPEEFMIIAPNKFFLNYISEILPDLGVENVRQYTFEDFAYEIIGKKIKISDNNEKLVQIVNNQNIKTEILIQESKFKSSLKFKQIIDEYLKHIEKTFLPREDFLIENNLIMSYKEIQHLFIEVYTKECFSARLFKIKKDLNSKLREKIPIIIENIKKERSNKIKALENNEYTEEKIRKKRIEVFEEKEKILKELENKPEKIVDIFIKKVKINDGIYYYEEFIKSYINTLEINSELKEYLINNTLLSIKQKSFSYEDLAPMMYLQYKISGLKNNERLKHVVIDEAQDYGEFQFYILRTILDSNSMTILGDISQGIYYYRGIENWKQFIEIEFPENEVEYKVLSKTYRTTKEIMSIANKVLLKLPSYEMEKTILGEPVIDKKDCVTINRVNNENEIIKEILIKIDKYKKEKFKSIAIIGKDTKECEYIYKEIFKVKKDIYLIQNKDSLYQAGINIVPSYLAKGLEFDCVIIFNANKKNYTNSSLDIKILYVAITRAMSKLDIFYVDEKTELLE